MKKTNKISMAVLITLAVIAAAATFTSCTEEHTVESTLDELRSHPVVDTIPVHDTTTVYRDTTIHDTVTEVREVVVTRTDTVTIPGESHEYTLRLRQWHNRWLGVSGGYLIGEDSVVLTKWEGSQLIDSWRGTARHSGTISLSVGTAAYPVSVIGDSCWIAAQGNGVYSGNMANHNVVMTLGQQSIIGPVVLNGYDWAPYLTAHEAIGQRVRFDADGNARGFAIDADGRAAGVVTAPYTTTTPEDTSRRFLWADTAYTHLSTNPTGVWSGNQVKWSCVNRRTITEHYSSAPTIFTRDSNFLIWFPYTWSCTGSATPAMDGQTVNFNASGTATWSGGLSVTLTALPRQCSIVPIPLPCSHSLTTGTIHWNNGSPYVTISGSLEGTTTTATHTVPAESRHETGRDTAWNGCGALVNSSITSVLIQHTLARTGVVTVNYNIAPLTYTYNISESTMYYSQYMVSGSANPSAIGTTASFTGNSVTIGGVTLVITPGTQQWCVLTYTTATLTSNGLLVSFSYNGGTGTVTIPVPWNNPDPIFTSVLAAAATDTYTHQIFSQASYRTTYVCVVAQVGTNYRFYWAELQAGLTRADFDSVSITSTEATFYVNHLADGYYPAMVCDHTNHVTLYRGVVSSVELGTGWQQTYRLAPSNSLAYVMGGSSWTMAGDNGRSAVRGVMNSSGQILADGITVQLY